MPPSTDIPCRSRVEQRSDFGEMILMYANAYEMKMPTNYVDMSADEIEYIAGESQASIKGKALKAPRQRGGPKTTEESEKKAMDVTVAMIGFAVSIPFGTIGVIASGLSYLIA